MTRDKIAKARRTWREVQANDITLTCGMPEYSLLYQQCFPPQLCPPNKAPKTASKEDDSRALVKGEE